MIISCINYIFMVAYPYGLDKWGDLCLVGRWITSISTI